MLAVMLLASCATRVRYEYFEPSGMGVTIRSPSEAPPNVAFRKVGASGLSVWARVVESGRIEVSIRAEVSFGHSLAFSGSTAKLMVSGTEQPIPLHWTQLRVIDGRGAFGTLEFDAYLVGPTFTGRPPRKGVHTTGHYDCMIVLPDNFSNVDSFTLVLPPPLRENEPLKLVFERKVADYRIGYQLQ
jgi:hypothetical protein